MRDHAPDAAAWMIDIAGIAGDDVEVAVHHGPAGGMAYVQPEGTPDRLCTGTAGPLERGKVSFFRA